MLPLAPEWPWILGELRPHRGRVAALLGLSSAEIGLRVLLPWPVKAILDHIAANLPLHPATAAALGPFQAVLGLALESGPGLTLVSVLLAGLLVQLAHQSVLLTHSQMHAVLGQRLVRDVRERLFGHLQALALVHHDRQPTGDAVYRLEADALAIETVTLRVLFPLVFSALTLAAMLSVLATLDWRLALAALFVVPALLFWMRWRMRQLAVGAEAAKNAEAEMISQLYESFSAIRLVKSFAREPYERRRFTDRATAVMMAKRRAADLDARFSLGVGMLTALGTTIVLGAGGTLLLAGETTPGTLLVALTYLGFVYGPLSGIVNTSSAMQHSLLGVRRVRETLGLPREDEERPHAVEAPALQGHVQFDGVYFAYDERTPVLHDVSFEAAPGQLVALVGPSGAGKTSLASLLPRFHEPTAGTIRIDGHDIRAFRLAGLRRQVAIVLQEAVVVSGSVADNLRYGRLDATDVEVEEAARLANAHEFILSLPRGYQTILAEAGRTLSGGQRQRLSIARAFLKRAPIVVLDEPTAALDTVSEQLVVEALGRLRAGSTTFVIAHRLSTVRHADLILLLDRGRLVARGTHADLLERSPLYRQLASTLHR